MESATARFGLEDKVALVTGGLGILGKGFCEGLASVGAKVVVVDLDIETTSSFADELSERFGRKCIGVSCDISNEKEVVELVEKVKSTFGRIDILHNNAQSTGQSLPNFLKPLEEYSLETWREVMAVNIDSYFLMAKHFGKLMKANSGGGSVIQTSSIYGGLAPDMRIYEDSFFRGEPISSPAVYSASKGAVEALTRYLAAYWAEDGIRVNTLTPGGVESGQNEAFIKKYSERIPMRRMADRNDLVGGLIYLASDASAYVTGHNLVVDGGLRAW